MQIVWAFALICQSELWRDLESVLWSLGQVFSFFCFVSGSRFLLHLRVMDQHDGKLVSVSLVLIFFSPSHQWILENSRPYSFFMLIVRSISSLNGVIEGTMRCFYSL